MSIGDPSTGTLSIWFNNNTNTIDYDPGNWTETGNSRCPSRPASPSIRSRRRGTSPWWSLTEWPFFQGEDVAMEPCIPIIR